MLTGATFVALTAVGGEASLRRIAPLLLFYAMADGVLAIAASARSAWTGEKWGRLCMEGAAGVTGVVAIGVWPETALATLLWIAAAWAGVAGVVAATGLETRADRLVTSAIAELRFAAVAAGAARAGESQVALWSVAGAVLLGVLLLARGGRPAPGLAQMRIR